MDKGGDTGKRECFAHFFMFGNTKVCTIRQWLVVVVVNWVDYIILDELGYI